VFLALALNMYTLAATLFAGQTIIVLPDLSCRLRRAGSGERGPT
jgi:hypothetical protein